MARSLRSLIRTGVLVSCGLASGGALAECKFPPDWECDFKNEDTHLWWYQPGTKFVAEDSTDTLVNDAWTAVHEYYATTKTTGDGAIRDTIRQMSGAIDEAIASAIGDLAITAQNDPFSLKPIYTDIICDVFWGVVAGRTCSPTSELVLDGRRLYDLAEVRAAILELEAEPAMFLGEQWGDIAADVQLIRDEFKRAETLGRNLDPDALADEARRRFRGYADVLAGPKTTEAQWIASRREISATLHSTMLDTLEASAELARQVDEDRGDLDELAGFGRDAVGRMQAMELANMTGVQANQEWMKIQEILVQRGNLIGLDMAARMNKDATRKAEGERARRPLPNVGTIIGNEVGAILP